MTIAAIVAFTATLLLIRLLQPVAFRYGLLARPGEHRQHATETPLTGGLAMYAGITLAFALSMKPFPMAMFVAITLVMVFGMADDRWILPYWVRFVVQIVAALIMVYQGNVGLADLGHLTSDTLVNLGEWSVALTVFATVGVINAINMIDGMDGLAGSLVVVCLAAVTFFVVGGPHQAVLLPVILIASVVGFLVFNGRFFGRSHGVVFMGDAGSMMLGILLAWLLIKHSQLPQRSFSPVMALWMLAIPLFDTVGVMTRRLVRGESPFKADWMHTHHLLIRAGCSVNQALALLVGAAVTLAVAAVVADLQGVPESGLFYAFLALFGCYLVIMETGHKRVQR